MMKKYFLSLAILLLVTSVLRADPPDPPIGKRWVLNTIFSDEFNGTKLDSEKWYDYHPNWKGRPPGIFLPSQVKVKDGFMSITGVKLAKDTVFVNKDGSKISYNIAGGAVVSKTTDAYFGYYECKFKAAKTTMSTTFWMSTRGNFDGPKDCKDTYGLELDFQECIGREGDFDGKYFANGMNSNSHYWYTDCDGGKHDYRAPQSKIVTPTKPSEDFYVYGGWWHDESMVSYYLNDRKVKTVDFYTGVTEKPFNKPMGLNMVSETYPFPWISLPTDEELADPTKNTCYYDWVRVYDLIDVDAPNVKKSIGEKIPLFNENILFVEKPKSISSNQNVALDIVYKSNEDRELLIKVFDAANKSVLEQKEQVLEGFGRKELKISTKNKLQNKKKYTVRVFIKDAKENKTFVTDEFDFEYLKG